VKKSEFEKLPIGTKIQHYAGGQVYTIVKNENGKIEAIQKAEINIIGEGKDFEHYPWDVIEISERAE